VRLLDQIYTDLEGEFAYRVIDEISKYVAINTMMYGDDRKNFIKFMDEQINQKILPKLHGAKAQLKPKLDKLQKTLSDEKFVLTNKKLNKMQVDIQKGYASYIGD